MTADFKTAEQTAVAAAAKRPINSGADHEIVLVFLRERGFDKLDSIKTLKSASGMSLGDAKNIVHQSRAWQDLFARDEKFYECVFKAIQALGLDEPSR